MVIMASVASETLSNGDELDENLLDLHFLTEEERCKLQQVLEEDHKLLMQDRVRVG